MINKIVVSKLAEKHIKKLPKYIKDHLYTWMTDVKMHGLLEVRKVPGYHDEPLSGDRKGQRSIRLNRSYRAIYVVIEDRVSFVRIEEVTKHEY